MWRSGLFIACTLLPAVAGAQTRYLDIYNDAPSSLVSLAAAPAGTEAFHDLVLGEGPLPLDILEQRVDAWITASGA